MCDSGPSRVERTRTAFCTGIAGRELQRLGHFAGGADGRHFEHRTVVFRSW
jgi:hypothetical protein